MISGKRIIKLWWLHWWIWNIFLDSEAKKIDWFINLIHVVVWEHIFQSQSIRSVDIFCRDWNQLEKKNIKTTRHLHQQVLLITINNKNKKLQ